MNVTAIFDIGKTNKKFFLFNSALEEVYREYISFDEITDDDGYHSDDLPGIVNWVKSTLAKIAEDQRFTVEAVNFSAYGATLVHLDEQGQPVTPLYNYTKPFPEKLWNKFCNQYNFSGNWSIETGSPYLGMLNAGLQLYWLKYEKPHLFDKITCSVFLPQYLCYLLTGQLVTEYTGIGCHTGLWNYPQNDYHQWVYAEDIARLLPPIKLPALIEMPVTKIKVGLGIHDSSAALLAYLSMDDQPFMLLSTGTWSICLNAFAKGDLQAHELNHDCLLNSQPDGHPVIAARLFLGHEHNHWVKIIEEHFGEQNNKHKRVVFDESLYLRACEKKELLASEFSDFEAAYHELILFLARKQVQKIQLAAKDTGIKKIYVDGGFADNLVFLKILEILLPGYQLIPTDMPLGSAKGAAMVLQQTDHFY
jgi:L-fuculokinase